MADLVTDVAPAQVELLLGDTMPHGVLGGLATFLELAVFAHDVELVQGDDGGVKTCYSELSTSAIRRKTQEIASS